MGKKKAKKLRERLLARSDTPVYDQLVVEAGFVPHQFEEWRNIPGGPGMLEDNFS